MDQLVPALADAAVNKAAAATRLAAPNLRAAREKVISTPEGKT
jgi:hypothetical protein